MALLIVHHNTFFNISDHLMRYVKGEFKDSKATKNFSCGRTETAAIINCIGDDTKQELEKDMSQSPFSIMVDGSNYAGLEKMFPICIRIFDVNFNRIMTKFFDKFLREETPAQLSICLLALKTSYVGMNYHGIWSHQLALTIPTQILEIKILLSLVHLKETRK